MLSIAAIFNTFLILNYLLWIVGLGLIAGKIIFFWILLFSIISLAYCIIKDSKLWPLIIFLVFIALLFLGTPSDAWDARSIWLFHAKRIFVDGNIFSQFDGYAGWSHNNYPVIVPALSASMASAVGGWNEIFPKTAGWFFIVSPLLVMVAVLRNSALLCLFFIGLMLICKNNLFNGYMDSLVALNLLSAIMTLPRYSLLGLNNKLNFNLYYLSATTFMILALIKNEGFLLVKICLGILFIANIYYEKNIKLKMLLIIFGGAFLLGMSWIKLANNHGIYDVMLSSTSIIHNFLKRYHDFDNYLKIFTSLNGSLMLIVIIFGIFIYLKNIKNTAKVICVPLLVFALYFIAIFFVYLTTPYDLVWHISTSVNRLKITLNVLLYGVVLGVLSSLLFSQKQPKILS